MRKRVVSLAAAIACFLIAGGCAGVETNPQVGIPVYNTWNGFVAAPPNAYVVLAPGQPYVILIQPAPYNGFFFPNSGFFNAFIGANPNLGGFCPGFLTIGSPFVSTTPIGNLGTPTIQVPIFPSGFGYCQIPFNLGSSGIVSVAVTVSAAAATSRARASSKRSRTSSR